MLSSAALRARVASIIDALSRTAVAEIAKVVEDGMMVLRLEMCQRENEINRLKSSIELLHTELSAAQRRATLAADPSADGETDGSSAGDARTLLVGTEHDNLSGLQVKPEPVDETSEECRGRADGLGGELALHEGSIGQWTPSEPQRRNSDYLAVAANPLSRLAGLDAGMAAPSSYTEGIQAGTFGRGLLGSGQLRNLYGAVRKRTVKRLMFKKGYICPYCGKCFERAGHLERHKRIHTGEKPYRCEMCGRRFNQKCSLKEHMKIHSRCIEPRLVEISVGEEKQILGVNPCSDARRADVDGHSKAERGLANIQDNAGVQVKSEPKEESITQTLFNTKKEADALTETFGSFEGDGQTWTSASQRLNNTEMSGAEYPGGSGQTETAQLLPVPADASCRSFSFPGKPYGELQNGGISQPPHGSSDTFLISRDSGSLGTADTSSRPVTFEMLKPKKCFVCSYCGKIFERSGHLERHLRIHTGEKPYGCHICGRCFNQNSSLKGHMRTHKKTDATDVLGPHHLMFTLPDPQPLESLSEPAAALAAFDHQVPGSVSSEAAEEQTALVKVEDFQTVRRAGIHSGPGASDQLVTCGVEPSSNASGRTVCVLVQDPQYLSPADQLQGYAPVTDLPFDDDKDELIHADRTQPRLSGLTQLVSQEVDGKDQSPARDRTPVVSEFSTIASGHEEAAGKNCFICSHCRRSFDTFSLFQMHRCKNVAETFTCEICDKVFNQLSILKLHLKLHAI